MVNLYISLKDENTRLIVDGNLQLFRQLLAAIEQGGKQVNECQQKGDERCGLLEEGQQRGVVQGVSHADSPN